MDSPRVKEEIRVVFDTNVLLSSTLWEGSSSQKVLFGLIRRGIEIFLSDEIIAEYVKVLKREFEYSDKEIEELVEKIKLFARLARVEKRLAVIKEDESDNRIIECALAAKASHILTYDKHLLRVGEYEGIKIQTPEDLKKIG